jgi:hypothetical protein
MNREVNYQLINFLGVIEAGLEVARSTALLKTFTQVMGELKKNFPEKPKGGTVEILRLFSELDLQSHCKLSHL